MKRPPLFCVHAVKQKASLAKSGLTSLATAAGGMYCVSMCKCVCVCVWSLCVYVRVCASARVFVSVKMRWPDCSAEQGGKTRPSCCQNNTNKNPQEMDHNAPRLGSPSSPSPLPPCFVCVPCFPPPSHAHTPHTGTPDHAKADLEMKNDPPLAVHCCISSQL